MKQIYGVYLILKTSSKGFIKFQKFLNQVLISRSALACVRYTALITSPCVMLDHNHRNAELSKILLVKRTLMHLHKARRAADNS
jgi:hypothetical protein